MLEYVPIPAIILGSLAYAWWRKAYLTQVMVISNFLIFLYMFILIWQGGQIAYRLTTVDKLLDAYAFVPSRFGQIEYIPSIFTSMFMHIEPLHVIGNVLFLYLLGLPLEERVGSRNWGAIYVSAHQVLLRVHPR